MIDEGDEVAHRVRTLADEFILVGHKVSLGGVASVTEPPDVLHAYGWRAVESLGSPDGGAVVVATLDEPDLELVDPVRGRLLDRVIAQSSEAVRRLLSVGMRRERLGVIPDGVDTAFFNTGPAGPRLRSDMSSSRIVCVRRTLTPDSLVDVMTALRRTPEARLFVAGGPPSQQLRRDPVAQEVASAARRIGVASRVFLLGGVPAERMPDLYRSADAVVCTGEPDAARTALEAMACAVPVVGFAGGPLSDIITHGVSGILVERGDITGLAAALRGLLAAEPRRYAYAVAGLSRVQERFTWPRVAEQIEGVYRAAIADRQGPQAVLPTAEQPA